jgi:hypothetical protein
MERDSSCYRITNSLVEGWPRRLTHGHILSANPPPTRAPCNVETHLAR